MFERFIEHQKWIIVDVFCAIALLSAGNSKLLIASGYVFLGFAVALVAVIGLEWIAFLRARRLTRRALEGISGDPEMRLVFRRFQQSLGLLWQVVDCCSALGEWAEMKKRGVDGAAEEFETEKKRVNELMAQQQLIRIEWEREVADAAAN